MWFLLSDDTSQIGLDSTELYFGDSKEVVIKSFCDNYYVTEKDLRLSHDFDKSGLIFGNLDQIQIVIGQVKSGKII